jgi:hypothetical protein
MQDRLRIFDRCKEECVTANSDGFAVEEAIWVFNFMHLRSGLHRSGPENPPTHRRPVWQEVVTHVLETISVAVTLDGEPLSQAEIATLLARTDGLVLLRGEWVEVDRAVLRETPCGLRNSRLIGLGQERRGRRHPGPRRNVAFA